MLKPLLRTIAPISGNVKLACTLLDYNKISSDTYETYIRGAKLLPLTSSLFQKSTSAGLLSSSWEYDIKKFYSAYADVFFDDKFEYNKLEMLKLDKTSIINTRNTDFEYGVKRISYLKSGCEFSCYAPIYVENVKDIPYAFKLNIIFKNNRFETKKSIIVNILRNDNDYNYIAKYLKKYFKNIDDNVTFMDNEKKEVSYYGIDLINGGFTKKSDATISALFNIQMPIQKFDYTLSTGFMRNRLCIRQVMPLAFYFNPYELLDSIEYERFKNCELYFSGNYLDSDMKEIQWYDFDWDYDLHTEKILSMNNMTGALSEYKGYADNIMDIGFPSFNDCNLLDYQFANKLSAKFCRWKLKYSLDEHPYITNMSWAFSNNQNSNYKYREFPSAYVYQSGYAIVDDSLKYNLVFPLDEDIKYYNEINLRSAKKYRSIMNNYCLSWFDVLYDGIVENELDRINWADTNNGYAYFDSILYNLNAVYNRIENIDDIKKIDKFATIIYPDTTDILDEEYIKDYVKFVSYTITPNSINYSNTGSNCTVNKNFFNDKEVEYIYDIDSTQNTDMVEFDKSFVELEKDENGNYVEYEGKKFINSTELGIDYVKLNSLVRSSDVSTLNYMHTWKYPNSDLSLQYFQRMIKTYFGVQDIHEIEKILNFKDSPKEIEDAGLDTGIDAICKAFILADEQYLPKIMTEDYLGYNLFEKLPVYRGQQYIKEDGKIDPELLKAAKQNNVSLWINTSRNVFNPVKIDLEKIDINNPIYVVDNSENFNVTFTHTLYVNDYFVDAAFYENNDIDANILNNLYLSTGVEDANYNTVFETEEGSVKPSEILEYNMNLFYHALIQCCKDIINDFDGQKYLYHPIFMHSKETIANNIVEPIGKHFMSCIDDTLYDDNGIIDDNVIYMHPYNVHKICDKIFETTGKTYAPTQYATLYAKVLNVDHLKILLRLKEDEIYIPEGASYIKEFYKQEKVFVPSSKGYIDVKFLYTPLENLNATEVEDKILYDDVSGMFFNIDDDPNNIRYYNIVEKNNFIKIDKTLWDDFINIDEEDISLYRDIFVYRPMTNIEFDEKYSKYSQMKTIKNNVQKIEDFDTMLYPCFNDPYVQKRDETIFYKNWCLNNITKTTIYTEDKSKVVNEFYRYNVNNASLFICITDEEIEKLKERGINLTIYRDLFNQNKIFFDVDPNSPFKDYNINIYDKDGIRYGYYLIRIKINNTLDFLNVRGLLDTDENSNNASSVEQIQNIKYLTIINGIDITKDKKYINEIFKQLCPFTYVNLLGFAATLETIMQPTAFSLTSVYSTIKDETIQNSDLYILKYNKQTITSAKKQILQRYTNAIVPYIKETYFIENQYNLKLKNINMTLIDTGKYNSLGDSVIYKDFANINYPNRYNIYGLSSDKNIFSYNNIVDTYLPLEYKHYNSSKMINLEKEFIVESPNKFYNYEDLLLAESDTSTFEIFKSYMKKYIVCDDLEFLFLYKKYNISYITEKISVTPNNKNIYNLKYKFNLL